MDTLKGKTAVVTGSGQNIGRAIAQALAREGARVVVNGLRNRDAVEQTVAAIRADGGTAHAVMADVGDPAQVEALVREAEAVFGPVDIAVSNVGQRLRMPFEQIGIEDWQRTLNTNLSACFYLAHHVVPGMRARQFGRIIHISGYDGFAGHMTERAANVTAKAGMHGLTKAIARELGVHGITCNTVVPGSINTVRDMAQYAHIDMQKVLAAIPLRRIGEVEDIAQACLYLAADSGRFVTGQAIHVNGGEYMF